VSEDSTTTVVVAATANFGIAVAKGVAGALSGSAAMISESAHSLADTTNQVLLLVAVKRSDRPADERHPFGYGRERYFWTLLAAVGICVGGGVFSVMQGINELRSHDEDDGGHYALTYIVLGISFILESVSWLQARAQLSRDAKSHNHTMRQQLIAGSDPAVTTVFFEDTAALLGLLIAGTGIGLHQATGDHVWDGIASLAIGVLLGVVGVMLSQRNKHLLIGESADPRLRDALIEQLSTYQAIDSVDEVLTTVIGRGEVFVAARLDLDDSLSAAQVEALARQIERDVIEAHPSVRHFFVDVTADHHWPTQDQPG
jgi:cation diffusion facilitator family transporter